MSQPTSYYTGLFSQYPGAFGSVPGQIAKPKSIWEQTNEAVPGMAGMTGQAAGLASTYMSGALPQDVKDQIHDTGAAWGVGSGSPGSGIQDRNMMKMLGLSTIDLQSKGLADYASLFKEVSGTQFDPSLSAEIDSRNSMMKAAPDPAQAGQLQALLAAGMYGGSGGAGGNSPNNPAGGRGGGFSIAPPSSATSAFPWLYTGYGSNMMGHGYGSSSGGGSMSYSSMGGYQPPQYDMGFGSNNYYDDASQQGGNWQDTFNDGGWGNFNPYE